MKTTKLPRLVTLITGLFIANFTFSQTYSTFLSPTSPTHYSSGVTGGVCASCSIVNPENAADTSLTNFASMSVGAGVINTAVLSVKLTSSVSAGNTVGFVIERSSLVDASVLSSYTINTYSSGVLKESKTGVAILFLSISVSSVVQQSIHFTSDSACDEVELIMGSLVGVSNDVDVLYAYGHTSALPVELINFYGSAVGEQIVLNWQTASEINNSHFNVEKITENRVETIGVITGVGNSVNLVNYTFTDLNPGNGNNFYRLKQVDYDGAAAYSKTINVFYGKTAKKITVISDYTNRSLRVSVMGGGSVELLNSRGEILSTHHCESETKIDLSHLQNGVYWVKVTQLNGEVCTEKIVKM